MTTKLLISLIFLALTGCISHGGILRNPSFEDKSECPAGRYVNDRQIEVQTNWETQEQSIKYSWECTSYSSIDGKDSYRTGYGLDFYRPKQQEKPMYRERGIK